MTKIIDTTGVSQQHSSIDEQVERFTAIFTGLRKTMGAGFKHAHQHGFSTTQFMVLGLLEKTPEGGPWTISSIASAMGLDPATVVRTVDSLEKRGIVERRRDKQDRRQVFVEYTEVGRCARVEMHQQFMSRVRAIFGVMSDEGRASLMSGLEEFIRAGQNVAEEPGEPTEQAEYSGRSEKSAKEPDESTQKSLT